MNTFSLWWLLRRRSSDSRDPQQLADVLAVIAFAVTTAVLLVVIGGWRAFTLRAGVLDDADAGTYPFLAATAAGLLIIPLGTLGGAAARLTLGRRNSRLAAMRLAGATTSQVTQLTLLETSISALAGAALGVGAHFALIPAVTLLQFQNRPFTYGELLLPTWMIVATALMVVVIALISAGSSLAKVALTPLGVIAAHTPRPLHWSRIVPMLLVAGAFALLYSSGQGGMVVWLSLLVGGLATVNLIGPFIVSALGRIRARRAGDFATLLAARRLIDQPKTAWRSVGGVALATFIAGIAATAAMLGSLSDSASGSDAVLLTDIGTGGLLTLAIAAVVAAVSTGVLQSGQVIDQRMQYRNLSLAGTEAGALDRVRMSEIRMPLIGAVAVATVAVSLFVIPVFGATFTTSFPVMIRFIVSVLGACALVLLGAKASTIVARRVAPQQQ